MDMALACRLLSLSAFTKLVHQMLSCELLLVRLVMVLASSLCAYGKIIWLLS